MLQKNSTYLPSIVGQKLHANIEDLECELYNVDGRALTQSIEYANQGPELANAIGGGFPGGDLVADRHHHPPEAFHQCDRRGLGGGRRWRWIIGCFHHYSVACLVRICGAGCSFLLKSLYVNG